MKEFPPMHAAMAINWLVPMVGVGHEDEARNLIEPLMKKIPSATDTIKMALERLEINSKYRERNS